MRTTFAVGRQYRTHARIVVKARLRDGDRSRAVERQGAEERRPRRRQARAPVPARTGAGTGAVH